MCRLIFELPAAGGVIPTTQFYTLRLIRYVDAFDYVVGPGGGGITVADRFQVLVCEGLFCAFTIFFILEQVSLKLEIPRKSLDVRDSGKVTDVKRTCTA